MRSTEYYPVFRSQTPHVLATGLLPLADPKLFNDPISELKYIRYDPEAL